MLCCPAWSCVCILDAQAGTVLFVCLIQEGILRLCAFCELLGQWGLSCMLEGNGVCTAQHGRERERERREWHWSDLNLSSVALFSSVCEALASLPCTRDALSFIVFPTLSSQVLLLPSIDAVVYYDALNDGSILSITNSVNVKKLVNKYQ